MNARVAQYTCPIHETRVTPFSTFEHSIAPEVGVSGAEILLRSLNAKRRSEGLPPLAWCFACAKEHQGDPKAALVEAVPEWRPNLERRYLERSGIRHRLTGAGRQGRLRELKQQMKELRAMHGYD